MLLNLKDRISNKLQSLDLVNKWKSLSLVKKIICIVAIVIAITIGLFNLLIGILVLLFILLPQLWLAALFKPSILRSSTRIQASKRILFPFFLVFVAVGILCPYYNLNKTPTFWEYIIGNDAEFDERGILIKESNLSISDRIIGSDAKYNDKGDVLKKFESSILTYLDPFSRVYLGDEGGGTENGQTVREAKKGLFSYLLSEDQIKNE